MDSGEVAVENSRGIPSFGNLSTSHLKERYYGGGLHHHHRPHHSSPSSTMYLGTTTSTTVTYHQQPPVYHRYQTNSNNGTNTNNGSPGGTVYGPYTYQYPPHNHGRRGLKYYQHYGGQPTPITTTPSTTNSATQTVAPVNSSFRSKHTRYNPCSMFFSRGHCHYGANCRFSHDVNSIRTSQRRFINSKVQTSPETMTSAPLSAPALLTSTTTDSSQRYKWSNAVNGKSNHDELNSHDDEQFPQLRGKTRGRSVSTSNQSPERSHKATSPFKKMVFRDAVLKQKSDDDGDATPDCSSSTKSSVNSDGDDLSEAPEDESSNTSSPTRQSNSSFPQRFPHRSGYGRIHPSVDTWSGDVNDNGPRYSRHMSRSTDNNYFYRGNHLRYSNGTIQNTPQQAQQLVHPQIIDSEHVGYVVQPEYSSIGFGSGVDLGYSMLSTQANQYVEKLDAQLLALEPCHQTAITSLQELARNLWGDAVLEIYGSNYTRLALPKSDVDCVLVSPEAASEEPSSVLRRLSEELKVQEWAIHVDLLDGAKIPVLKIVYMSESSGGVEVMLDVTCGHSTGHSGLSARDIIYSYQTEMPALRPLVLILKSHIQSSGLNCAFTGGLSSYALVLLAIRFLQACGDKHYRTYDGATFPSRGHLCRERSYSEGGVCNGESRGAGDVTNSSVDKMETSSNWIYVFTRDGKVMWRTGLGNLLLLFLETYITFDYRHYGISIENTGEYFALPAEKVTLEPGAVVVPYIVDPIKPNRSIGNCFRMHEIIQVWYVLYQSIASGVPLEDALNASVRPV